MSGMSKHESERAMESCLAARESLRKSALADLTSRGIDPDSPAGVDFLLRTSVWGQGTQPPRMELNEGWVKPTE